jgi:sarcosine oxidase gamma subunit
MSDSRLALHEDEPCHEIVVPLVALERDLTLGFPAAQRPGAAAELGSRALILHFAPGRWLLTGDALEQQADRIERLRAAGALVIDGRAKWCRIELSGAYAREVLCGLLPVEQVLGARGCAAATLLDCPGVLAAGSAGLHFWVGRSWASWMYDTLSAWLTRCGARCAHGA